MYHCTHKNHAGTRKTVVHGGTQCTEDIYGEESSCVLFAKTWEWLSCEPAGGTVLLTEKGEYELVDTDSIEQQETRFFSCSVADK